MFIILLFHIKLTSCLQACKITVFFIYIFRELVEKKKNIIFILFENP